MCAPTWYHATGCKHRTRFAVRNVSQEVLCKEQVARIYAYALLGIKLRLLTSTTETQMPGSLGSPQKAMQGDPGQDEKNHL